MGYRNTLHGLDSNGEPTARRVLTMDVAREIAAHLAAAGFPKGGAATRQIHCLAEEAGELVGAHRRYAGMARRSGDIDEVRAELADVAIATYVMAGTLGAELEPLAPLPASPVASTPRESVLDVFVAVGRFVDRHGDVALSRWPVNETLFKPIIWHVQVAARALDIDLTEAVADKLDVIFGRVWRERS